MLQYRFLWISVFGHSEVNLFLDYHAFAALECLVYCLCDRFSVSLFLMWVIVMSAFGSWFDCCQLVLTSALQCVVLLRNHSFATTSPIEAKIFHSKCEFNFNNTTIKNSNCTLTPRDPPNAIDLSAYE